MDKQRIELLESAYNVLCDVPVDELMSIGFSSQIGLCRLFNWMYKKRRHEYGAMIDRQIEKYGGNPDDFWMNWPEAKMIYPPEDHFSERLTNSNRKSFFWWWFHDDNISDSIQIRKSAILIMMTMPRWAIDYRLQYVVMRRKRQCGERVQYEGVCVVKRKSRNLQSLKRPVRHDKRSAGGRIKGRSRVS